MGEIFLSKNVQQSGQKLHNDIVQAIEIYQLLTQVHTMNLTKDIIIITKKFRKRKKFVMEMQKKQLEIDFVSNKANIKQKN